MAFTPIAICFPARSIANRQARNAPGASNRQVNDAPRELRRGDASRIRRRNVRERRDLNLFTRPNLFKTSRNVFAHNFIFDLPFLPLPRGESRGEGDVAGTLVPRHASGESALRQRDWRGFMLAIQGGKWKRRLPIWKPKF